VAAAGTDAASAIVARGQQPTLLTVLEQLHRAPAGPRHEAVRLLAALAQDGATARDAAARAKVRTAIFEPATRLILAWTGGDGGGGASSDSDAARDATLATIEPLIAATLAGLAAEPPLAERFGEGGGSLLRLCCRLADAALDAETRAHAVVAIGACAKFPSHAWRLVGFGALRPLARAAAIPASAEDAGRALRLLHFEESWRAVPGADPLAPPPAQPWQGSLSRYS